MASILLIEDDADLRVLLRKWLEHMGHEVSEAANGREGISAYRNVPTELVLTDVFMPDEDGLGAICALRRHDPEVRIVAMSGGGVCLDAVDCLSQARALGAQATLQKPFRTKELQSAIDRALGTATAQ